MGCLGGIEEKVHHTQSMNDPAGPRGGLALAQRRRAFPAERRRQLPAEGCVLVSQVSLTEGISQLSDVVEPRLHVFGHLLRRTVFGHTTSSWHERHVPFHLTFILLRIHLN